MNYQNLMSVLSASAFGFERSRDRERREPGEGWIGTQAGTSHHCAMLLAKLRLQYTFGVSRVQAM